ncbi:hypothetical protein niasHT_023174 [Heterodera trifolii]
MQKDLKIKTGVLKRYLQEVEYYRKEVQKQTDKVNTLKAEESDQYNVKKAIEVLQENQQMVTLSTQNAKKAANELKSMADILSSATEQKALADELLGKAESLSV